MWIFDQDKRQDRRDVADLKEVLKTQLAALGERRYELTLRTRDDQVSYAHVSAADILDRVRDLRAVNLAGTDIALRPAERTGLVLLRDVPAARLADLREDGLAPVLVTEPRPERFDAWVRVDTVGIQRGLHDSMAQVIAARYGGDARTAGAEQAAPLAGFTTRADPDRRIPLVSADRASRVAPAALDLADWVLERAQLAPAVVAEQRGHNPALAHARQNQEEEREAVAARVREEEPGRREQEAAAQFTLPTHAQYVTAHCKTLLLEYTSPLTAARQFHAHYPGQRSETFVAVLRANDVGEGIIDLAVRAAFGDPPRQPEREDLTFDTYAHQRELEQQRAGQREREGQPTENERGGASPAAAPDRFTHPTPAHYMVAVYADLHAEQRVAHAVSDAPDAATRDQAASAAARAAAQEFHARFPYQQPDTFAAVLRANGVEDATIAAAVRAGFGDPPRGPDQAALRAELGGALRAAGLPVETGLALPIHPHPPAPAAPPAAPPDAAQFGTLRRALLAGSDGRLDERQAEWGAAHQLVDTYPQLTLDELVGALDQGGAAGQGQGRTPPEREAYIARTAEKVLAAAHASPGQEGPRTRHRDRRGRSANGRGGRTVHNGHAAATATAANQRPLSAGAQHDE